MAAARPLSDPGVVTCAGSLGVAGRGALISPGVAGRGALVSDPELPCQPWAAGLCAGRPTCVAHPTGRDCSELRTCRSRNATAPRLPRPAARCAPDGLRVCRIRQVAIAASRARPRAARAARTHPHLRLPRLAAGMCAGLPTCVQHPSHRDRRELNVPGIVLRMVDFELQAAVVIR
jgi:hypothetical protein